MSQSTSKLINSADAALLLGVSTRQVRRLASKGAFVGAERVGNDWLVPRSAIDDYYNNRPAVGRPAQSRSTQSRPVVSNELRRKVQDTVEELADRYRNVGDDPQGTAYWHVDRLIRQDAPDLAQAWDRDMPVLTDRQLNDKRLVGLEQAMDLTDGSPPADYIEPDPGFTSKGSLRNELGIVAKEQRKRGLDRSLLRRLRVEHDRIGRQYVVLPPPVDIELLGRAIRRMPNGRPDMSDLQTLYAVVDPSSDDAYRFVADVGLSA